MAAASWFNTSFEHFTAIYLKPFIRKNGHTLISTQIVSEIKKGYDAIIVGVYSTATSMLAIQYMIMNKIPYYLETDGGIAKNGKGISEKIKSYLIGHAKGYFSPSRSSDKYLEFYGADEKVIYRYQFTSLKESDLLNKPSLCYVKRICLMGIYSVLLILGKLIMMHIKFLF